jgi:hypothetical protein
MLQDQIFQLSDGFLPAGPAGQAISGVTPIVIVLQGPLNSNTSFDLFWTGTVAGAWKIEASNSYLAGGNGTNPRAGFWTDVTTAWRTPNATTGTAIPAAAGSAGSTYVEYLGGSAGAGFGGKSLRVTFTPTSGAGNIGIAANSNRQ